MDKKGQWARAMARERRSEERRERLGMTKELLKKGFKADDIAYKLGVSGLTVRQYIREVGHLADAEQNIDTLLGRISSLLNQIRELSNTKEVSNFKKGIRLGIDALNLMILVKKETERIDAEFDSKIAINLIEGLYSMVYSSTIASIYLTFLHEKNKAIPSNERKEFRHYFDKYMDDEHKLILEEDYKFFLEEAKELAERRILPNLPEVIKNIERKININKLLTQIDKEIKPILKELDLAHDDISKSGSAYKKYNFDILLLRLRQYKWYNLLTTAKIPLLLLGIVVMLGSPVVGLILAGGGMTGYTYQIYKDKKIRLKNKLEIAKKNKTLKIALVLRLIFSIIYALLIAVSIPAKVGLIGGIVLGFVFCGWVIMLLWHYENKILS